MSLPAWQLARMRTVLHEQANCRVTALLAPGTVDGYGLETADGTVLWSGDAPAFLTRTRRIRTVDGVSVEQDVDTLTILDGAGPGIVEVAGPSWTATRVQVADERTGTPVTATWRVTAIRHDAHGLLDHVTLDLTPDA